MKGLDAIKDYLSANVSSKRYIHSINTAATAEELAARYGVHTGKAYLAGLIHDCTRELDIHMQHQILKLLNIVVDDITFRTAELLHSYSAEHIIKKEFEIYDEEIIFAVRFHTTGKENMSLLEKIIFLSDVIEPSRVFPGVETIRQLAQENLDEALIAALDSSVKFLIGKRSLIHPNTFLARNYILKYLKD